MTGKCSNEKCEGQISFYDRHNFSLCWYHARRFGCPEVYSKEEFEQYFPNLIKVKESYEVKSIQTRPLPRLELVITKNYYEGEDLAQVCLVSSNFYNKAEYFPLKISFITSRENDEYLKPKRMLLIEDDLKNFMFELNLRGFIVAEEKSVEVDMTDLDSHPQALMTKMGIKRRS